MKIFEAQAIIGEADELKRQYIEKSADAIVRYAATLSAERKSKAEIEKSIWKLLERFSTEDKLSIMMKVSLNML